MDKWRIGRWLQSNAKPLWPYAQLALLILAFFAAGLWGFLIKPPDVQVPRITANSPKIYITANLEGVTVYDISSVLEDFGSGYPGYYYMTGTVQVPHGKSASVYIEPLGSGATALTKGGWKFAELTPGIPSNYALVKKFSQGISQLSLEVIFSTCYCVNYVSPYLAATTASVQTIYFGPAPEAASNLPNPYHETQTSWPVILGFRQSQVDIQNDSIPTDLSILTAFPQAPTNTGELDGWSWPDTADGSITAIDVGASAGRDMHLFYAGLLFGIAGSALVGSIQAVFTLWDVKGRADPKDSNDPTAAKIDPQGQVYGMSLQHLISQVTGEIEASLRQHLDRVKADVAKRQAVYDRVLRDGRGKSVIEVRELLAREWQTTFGTDVPEAELSDNVKRLAAGNRIVVVGPDEEITPGG